MGVALRTRSTRSAVVVVVGMGMGVGMGVESREGRRDSFFVLTEMLTLIVIAIVDI